MSYETFKSRISRIAKKTGMSVVFNHDADTGQHYARCGDVVFKGNETSLKVQVRWGSGHTAHTNLAEV